MTQHIVFRVDASEAIGTGHVMRCLVLAEELMRSQDCKITFIARELPDILFARLWALSNEVVMLPNAKSNSFQIVEDSESTAQFLQRCQPSADILIVDHYGIDEKWERRVRPCVKSIAVIDDLADRKHDCDWLLDQNYVKNMSARYEGLVPPSCRLFLGPSYTLLRSEFYKQPRRKRGWDKVHRALITFGGSDPTGETVRILDLIERGRLPEWQYDIVVGALNSNKEVIQARCSNLNGVHYYENVTDIARLINQADVCIGSPGISLWERSILGLPSILIVIADNQRESAEAVDQDGLAWNLGWHEDVSDEAIVQLLQTIQTQPQMLQAVSEKAVSMMISYDHPSTVKHSIHPFANVLLGGNNNA